MMLSRNQIIVTRKPIKRRALKGRVKQRAEKIAAVMRKFDGFGARSLALAIAMRFQDSNSIYERWCIATYTHYTCT
jgi:hypothetical protein